MFNWGKEMLQKNLVIRGKCREMLERKEAKEFFLRIFYFVSSDFLGTVTLAPINGHQKR